MNIHNDNNDEIVPLPDEFTDLYATKIFIEFGDNTDATKNLYTRSSNCLQLHFYI